MSNICNHKVIDAPDSGFDYSIIDGNSINLDGVDLESHDNFMDAMMHKYEPIYAFFISQLFSGYVGLQDIQNHIKLIDEVLSNKRLQIGGGSEFQEYNSNKKTTTITDYTPELYDKTSKPIKIFLPTSDFKKILIHINKTSLHG